ncbi:hypothetical protein [Paenibacillus larvae]|uniref:hypothetical protein n=1 Tax=Paenibacillus larvae TaxID=1464 RepID=UPI00288CBFC6|nr:hypothetical protein [Paenibacillus larvae]MDT2173304.1 hypothetical protein [Paenibacillus larvae]MDT2309560.1 hypothetical protein [Paenibacillus larvae]
MSAYDTSSKECPYCGSECEADWVDVGVGMVQCGPYHCQECGASEMGPEQREWYEFIDGRLVWKDCHPYNDKEIETGWYDPNNGKKISPYANTVNGVLVDHKTAKLMYDIGLLDEKKY